LVTAVRAWRDLVSPNLTPIVTSLSADSILVLAQ
jgi:hypothetical protein